MHCLTSLAYSIVVNLHTAHKAEYGISGFGVSITTMEEVFIKVGEGLDDALDAKLVNIANNYYCCVLKSLPHVYISGWSDNLRLLLQQLYHRKERSHQLL